MSVYILTLTPKGFSSERHEKAYSNWLSAIRSGKYLLMNHESALITVFDSDGQAVAFSQKRNWKWHDM
jgi:hypothetical protein